MVNTIIFDFGDIFINLDFNAMENAMKSLGLKEWNEDLDKLNYKFEKGKIKEEDFLKGIQNYIPKASLEQIKNAWSKVLLDFPLYRLEFLQKLSHNYQLFLLSNTDAIHVEQFENMVGESFSRDFYQCFEKVYFSFEIGQRKPEPEAFNYIINKHELSPKRTLFVDDRKTNTDVAESLGFQVWNLQVGEEDVVDLFDKKIISL
ncbi:Alpha-D-glucose-1-phosphate phosphatase YihX [compost metagenome]|uniref:Putative hydrolase of the HAD superfamily n=1 Tax=Flavobacterium endophyticum TaxID=1540163 RepID=A0A495MI37_9FLAO|nr:HAD family phosphatase [Flavobacterium endophyticum]RKS25644.1 putative hydrolase of the HAD superfamily [Flavobacterium endophyticum]